MPRFRLPAWLASVLLVGFVARAPAQLVTITAQGSPENLLNPSQVPAFISGELTTTFSLRLDQPADPNPGDPGTVTYSPVSASFHIAGQVFQLYDSSFTIERHLGAPFGPSSGYLLRGWTAASWFVSVHNSSHSLDYAPDFSIPQFTPPVGMLDIAHDLTLLGPGSHWAAYGDGVITSVQVTPVPESAILGPAAALALVAAAGWRWRVASPRAAT